MTTKPETVIKQIERLPEIHSRPLLQFKDWLVDEDSMLSNAANYLRVLKLFSFDLGKKEFKDVTREDVLEFLDKRKKSIDVDPEKKWVRTWNDYLARLVGFYRWLHNNEITKDREDWNTPEPFNSIKKKKNKRDSSYTPNDVWDVDELLLAVKYFDNIHDKAIFTIGWDMVSRNHEITKLKIKDIVIKDKYAEISTAWDTKTGIRTCPVIVGFPYLKELLNSHPFASDPNAFLIISRTSMKPLNPDSL
ncbi:MAG: site-specific integrase [Nitrosopumilus sp.]|nr:site-specific integrase [Nitrosopumilus sp.]MDH3488357.1 site-specific integrase [Nitrosopumilus sp.]